MNEPRLKKKTLYRQVLNLNNKKLSDPYRYQVHFFSENGLLTRETFFNDLGEEIRKTSYEYDQKKLVSEQYEVKSDTMKKIYSYENETLTEIQLYKNRKLKTQIVYTYQADGQYDEVTKRDDRKVRQKHYDHKGCLQWEVNLINGRRTDYNYDEHENVISIREENEEGHSYLSYDNRYDEKNRLKKVFINNNLSTSYSYDDRGLLKQMCQYGLNGEVDEKILYEYQFY